MLSKTFVSGSRSRSSGIVRSLRSAITATSSSSSVPSTTSRTFAYAAVNHAEEYKDAMEGRHGQQLSLAYKEAKKYENEVFDPFEAYKIDQVDEVDDEVDDGDEMELEETDVESDDDDDEDDDEDEEEGEIEFEDDSNVTYNTDGSIMRTRAELTSLKAGAPSGGKFAIVNLNGTQEKVTVDDVIITNKLKPVHKWSVGSTHTLTADEGQLLLLGSQEQTLVGLPFVNGGAVDVMVEEITRDKKVIVFKKKRRKNYRRKNGFKREVTFLRVLDIRFP